MVAGKYILDTHCLIWFQQNNPKLSKFAINIIEDTNNTILFSQVSLFELSIKLTIGKLPKFDLTIEEFYLQALMDGFKYLPIKNEHIFNYPKIPLLDSHRDPFDRLLIATAVEESAIIISGDEKFELYKEIVEVIW